MTAPHSLNIVGCGRLGKTLGRLFSTSGMIKLEAFSNRTRHLGVDSSKFIGAGQAITDYRDFPQTKIWLISTPDDHIEMACQQLAELGKLQPGNVIFHCSGSRSSEILSAAREAGCHVASIHPIHSFANPEKSLQSFAGTYCVAEGDSSALQLLEPLFQAIGGKVVVMENTNKALYHAATVFASNYLVSLLDTAASMFEQSGMERQKALELMAPIVRQTAENCFANDTTQALTGPIARGDTDTIAKHLTAIGNDQKLRQLYCELGEVALKLARKQNSGLKTHHDQIQAILEQIVE